jgi:hypothetical protein
MDMAGDVMIEFLKVFTWRLLIKSNINRYHSLLEILFLFIRVVRKLQFPNNFRLKTQNAAHFARTWETTNRVGEQVH